MYSAITGGENAPGIAPLSLAGSDQSSSSTGRLFIGCEGIKSAVGTLRTTASTFSTSPQMLTRGQYHATLRPMGPLTTSIVAAVLRLTAPHLGGSADTYAAIMSTVASASDIDPLLVMAVVEHESGWHANAISRDREDYGLGQIRARYMSECRKDRQPVRKPSKACRNAKLRLLNGSYNLHRTIGLLKENRDLCRKTLNTEPLERDVLASYAGTNRPSLRIWCGHRKVGAQWKRVPLRKVVAEVLDLRSDLAKQASALQSLASLPLSSTLGDTIARLLPKR